MVYMENEACPEKKDFLKKKKKAHLIQIFIQLCYFIILFVWSKLDRSLLQMFHAFLSIWSNFHIILITVEQQNKDSEFSELSVGSHATWKTCMIYHSLCTNIAMENGSNTIRTK